MTKPLNIIFAIVLVIVSLGAYILFAKFLFNMSSSTGIAWLMLTSAVAGYLGGRRDANQKGPRV